MTRLVKKEVIDLSDTMDLLAEVVHRQDQTIQNVEQFLHTN